ncbi:LysE family transporter [Alteromonas sp. 5E99-2]|uniref:LysE family translocator n=1 Tax=Alteromonas sp. 5E99-2 TaxID=2817683 RepID=UPI001A99F901|nr:LysE family transporter [Alteromonas sp. 5E99-2]MBO1255060.1 LysE family transporter [Alteromonas sp. 5E99-2]
MNWTEFATLATIHFLAVASPGPDFAVIVRHSMHHGKNIALVTSLGIGLAILVHVAYSLLGVSLIIATTPWLFSTIKYAAGAYLLYLAYGALTAQASGKSAPDDSTETQSTITKRKAFSVGFITNGLNPKATLFFLSIFTLVISPDTPFTIKAFYGGYFAVATTLWFCFLTLLLNIRSVREWLHRCGYWVDKMMGVLLLIVAANVLFFAHV